MTIITGISWKIPWEIKYIFKALLNDLKQLVALFKPKVDFSESSEYVCMGFGCNLF